MILYRIAKFIILHLKLSKEIAMKNKIISLIALVLLLTACNCFADSPQIKLNTSYISDRSLSPIPGPYVLAAYNNEQLWATSKDQLNLGQDPKNPVLLSLAITDNEHSQPPLLQCTFNFTPPSAYQEKIILITNIQYEQNIPKKCTISLG